MDKDIFQDGREQGWRDKEPEIARLTAESSAHAANVMSLEAYLAKQDTEIARLRKEVDGCHASDCTNSAGARSEIARLRATLEAEMTEIVKERNERVDWLTADIARLRTALQTLIDANEGNLSDVDGALYVARQALSTKT